MGRTMKEKPAARVNLAPWSAELKREFDEQQRNGCVGTRLLSEDGRVRVWEIRLAPGERIGFHRHVLDYFWTAVTAGRARSHQQDGTTIETDYEAGETRHESYRVGEYKVHDLENTGDSELIFTTVEFLDGANTPLALPTEIRAVAAE
jgi:beta-alanine degradation protein BauB